MFNTYSEMLGIGNQIAEVRDSLGPVRVFDNNYERYLTFDSIFEQSCQKKSDPGFLLHEYTRAMILPLVFQAIERRQVVIDIAHQYFQVPSHPRLTIRCEDAADFMGEVTGKVTKGSVDLLFCDLFNANGLDELQCRPAFLADCHAALSENGWAAFNYFNGHAETLEAIKNLEEQFDAVYTCYLFTGNLIALAAKKTPDVGNSLLVERARRLEKHLGFSIASHFLHLDLVTQEKLSLLNSRSPVF